MKKSISHYNWIIWIGLSFLFILIVLNANNLSLTHDEALSYTISQGVADQKNTANNHVLNTFFMKGCSAIFGNSEFSLRLPNVIAGGLYFIGIYYLLRRKKFWLAFFGASLLSLNPYLIEYFSLARGYGLSFGFMLISIYFASSIKPNFEAKFPNFKNYFLAIVFAFLATNANLAIINYMIALLVLFSIHYLILVIKNSKKSFVQHIPFLLLFLVSCVVLYFESKRLLLLQENNQLYFGEHTILNMIQSISISSIYNMDYFAWTIDWTKYFIGISILIGAFLILWKRDFSSPVFFVFALIITILFGLTIEDYLFKSKYPSGRSAFYFVPLFSIYIYFLVEKLIDILNIKKAYYIPILLLFLAPIFLNFYFSIPKKATREWAFDSRTKEVLIIIKEKVKNKEQKSTIANHWLFEPSLNYYIETQKLNIEPANRNTIDYTTDFVYRLDDDSIVNGYKVIAKFPEINTNLLEKTK